MSIDSLVDCKIEEFNILDDNTKINIINNEIK